MSIEFRLIADPNPTVYRVMTIASQAYAVGDAVAYSRSAGTVIPATSATINANIYGVAMEAKTSADTSLLVCVINDQQLWGADATNTTNTAHNYQRMVLTDKATVNNTGTDSASSAAVVTQEGILSATRITVSFNLQASVS